MSINVYTLLPAGVTGAILAGAGATLLACSDFRSKALPHLPPERSPEDTGELHDSPADSDEPVDTGEQSKPVSVEQRGVSCRVDREPLRHR